MGTGASTSAKSKNTNTSMKDAASGKMVRFRHGGPNLKYLETGSPASISLVFAVDKTNNLFFISAPVTEEQIKKEEVKENGKEVKNNVKQKKEAQKVRWIFYNDSKHYSIKVTATFLGNTSNNNIHAITDNNNNNNNNSVEIQNAEVSGNTIRAIATVQPCETLPFVEGVIGGHLFKYEVVKKGETEKE